MKKIFVLAVAIFAFNCMNAQNNSDDLLKEYTGKYKFPEGTPFQEVTITLENGTLMASSAAGVSELKRLRGDSFDIVSYGGVAIFKRSEDKKVNKVQVQVNDLDVEGEKTGEGSLSAILARFRNDLQGIF